MPFLIWGLKSPDRELRTSQRDICVCIVRLKSFNIWTKIFFYHLPGHIVSCRTLYYWFLVGKWTKKKGPQDGISDQKLLIDCEHRCICIVDDQQRWQRLMQLTQWSSAVPWTGTFHRHSSDQTPFMACGVFVRTANLNQSSQTASLWADALRNMFTYPRATWVHTKFHVSPN